MASFNIDTSSIQAKPPQVEQMKLSDMLNMASKGYELKKMKELYPAMIEKAKAESESAQSGAFMKNIEASQASIRNKEQLKLNAFMQDPKNYMDENGDIDLTKANKAIPIIAPMTGTDHLSKLSTLAQNNTLAKDAKLKFSQNEREIVASTYGALGRANVTDPKEYANALDNLVKAFPDSPSMKQYADAAKGNLMMVGDHSKLPAVAIGTANQLLTLPQQQTAFTPTTNVATVGGQQVPVTTTPSATGGAPQVNVGQFGGTTPQTKPPASAPGMPKIVNEDPNLTYNGPAQPLQLNPVQEKLFNAGQENFNKLPALQQQAQEAKEYVRGATNAIEAAKGSTLAQKLQAGGKYVFENPELDRLTKNLAGVLVSNANTMGLNRSDASFADAEKLSGSAKISNEALKDILQRADAQASAADKYATAVKNYREKRGEINASIHEGRFKSAWSNAYDSKIFQMDNIANSNLPDEEKTARIQDLTKNMSPSAYTKFVNDAKTIHRLEQGKYQ